MARRSSSRLWTAPLGAQFGCISVGPHHLLLLLLYHVVPLLQKYDLMLEFMVNHISPGSAEFKDFKEHGAKSKFADLFVSWERIWGKCECHASALRGVELLTLNLHLACPACVGLFQGLWRPWSLMRRHDCWLERI